MKQPKEKPLSPGERNGNGAAVGRPRKLTAEAIIQAALQIIDQQGAGRLSIRSLAAHLKVQATAIYTHYDNLEIIEDAVVDRLLSEMPMPDASLAKPLREQLIDYFVSMRSAHILHPRLSTVGREGSPAWNRNLQHIDAVLAQLVARKVDLATAEVFCRTLTGVTLLNALQETSAAAQSRTTPQKTFAAIKAAGAPLVLEMLSAADPKTSPEDRFRQLAGTLIDRLLPASVAKGGKGKAP